MMVTHPFQHSAAQSTCSHAVLYGDNPLKLSSHFFQKPFIQRFEEAHVIMSSIHTTFLNRLSSHISNRTDGKYSHILTLAQSSACTYINLLQWTAPVHLYAPASRVPDDKGSLIRQLSRIHQSAQFMFIHRCSYRQIWNRPQGSQVKGTMMRSAILSHQSSPVQTENHRQIEYSYIMDDIIESTLCKSTIDIAERLQSILSHTATESHGMSLGDAHIEHAVGHILHHDVHGASSRHSRCNTHDFGVLFRQFQQCFTEHVLIFRRLVTGILNKTFACIHIKLTRSMPDSRMLLGRFISFTLHGMQMEQFWTLHLLQLAQDTHQRLEVITCIWAKIADIHTFKDVLLMADGRLQCIGKTDNTLSAVFFQHSSGM